MTLKDTGPLNKEEMRRGFFCSGILIPYSEFEFKRRYSSFYSLPLR